jgi:hypothetical protein
MNWFSWIHKSEFLRIILFSFSIAIALACRPRLQVSESSVEGLYAANSKWPNATASTCFLRTAEATVETRNLVKKTVETEINQVTGFTFTGFSSCEDMKSDIVIDIASTGNSRSSIGRSPNTFALYFNHGVISKGRIRLNFHKDATRREPINFVHNTIVHEFGHALGLHHELRRKDATCSALSDPEGHAKDGVPVGSYDPDSIMNYCNQLYQTTKITLSPGDLATIWQMYPALATGRAGEQPLRCERGALLECITSHGDELCVTQSCQGGNLFCRKGNRLKKCVAGHGGVSCLDSLRGDCHE